MVVTKVFAPGRARDERGWLIYERDTTLRREMYPSELVTRIMTHPAKQQAHLHRDICEFVSEPGETILDCFGGIGTSLISATLGRNVILVELEPYYFSIIQDCIKHLESSITVHPLIRMLAINADNRLAMPIPCDHIITSPPYGNDLYAGANEEVYSSTGQSTKKLMLGGKIEGAQKQLSEAAQYGKSTQNLGKLNTFLYEQSMKRVYEKMVQSVRVGGTITITHRDRMREGQRVLYIDSIIQTLVRLGCKVHYLDKWKVPDTMQASVNKNAGFEVVEDEDIIVMRRER